jgi:hypothetical protein
MQAVQRQERTWRFPGMVLKGQLEFALLVWAAASVFSNVLVAVVANFRSIEISAWEVAAGIAPWFVAFMSGWVMFVLVPMFVANGRTRRDSFIEWGILAVIYPIGAAVLTAIGYLIEHLVYELAGWNGQIDDNHWFSSRTDVGMIVLEFLFMFLVWTMVGGFVGAALYRSADLGWFSILPGTLLILLSGSMDRSEFWLFGFIRRVIPEFNVTSLGVAIPLALVGATVAFILAWLVVRDMSLRNH